MVRATVLAVAAVVGSLAISVAVYLATGHLFVFLVVPIVPFLLRGRAGGREDDGVRTCPECGFHTRDDDYDYCPRDGTPLE